MNNSNWGEPLVRNGGAGISRCLCIPCAVSERDFNERIAANGGQWDGADAPRACINGREYNLIYSPAPVKVSCSRCGEEIHWAYHPDAMEPAGIVPPHPAE
jgi:hypothetical protein